MITVLPLRKIALPAKLRSDSSWKLPQSAAARMLSQPMGEAVSDCQSWCWFVPS
jgi:hypothetical protein